MEQLAFKNNSRYEAWLHRYAIFLTSCTFLLLIAGALVTGNHAGLAVPDWPLSFGQLMPPMVGGVLFEHGHRLIAALVGFLTALLALWIWMQEKRPFVRKLGLFALLSVVAQGLLGGMTVLLKLPALVSMAHACLAQTFFCIMVSLSWITIPQRVHAAPPLPDSDNRLPLHHLSLAILISVFLQLILGAALRHSALGPGREHFQMGITLHIAVGFLVASLAIWMALRVLDGGQPISSLALWVKSLVGLIVVQLMLGVGSYLVRVIAENSTSPSLPVIVITTIHLAVGALILSVSLILTLQISKVSRRGNEMLVLGVSNS
jgi:cytochrome c oxidase assembly protein subunit 15